MSQRSSRPRSRISAAVLLVVALGSIAGRPGPPIGAERGSGGAGSFHLRSGRFRLAADAYIKQLEKNPNDIAANYGLGVAMSQLGDCERATAAFDKVRHDGIFRGEGYVSEGLCALRDGKVSLAVERFEEAVTVAPWQGTNWFQLMVARNLAGDREGALVALRELEQREPKAVTTDIARTRFALGTDAFWYEEMRLAEKLARRPRFRASPQVYILTGRAQLLEGAPAHASQTFLQAARLDLRNQAPAVWRAEACRRTGNLECSQFAINRPAVAEAEQLPITYAVRARVLADEGRLDDAAAVLADHPNPVDPERVASAWYLARARGDDTAALESLYDTVRRPDTGDLSLLIPWSSP